MNLKNKNILLVGLAKTGVSTIKLLNKLEANIIVNDIKDEGEYVTLEFEWDKYEGGQLLSEKYHSKTAEEKFKNKERRENYAPTIDFSSTIS